ncbi:hypothetical protein ACOSP7_027193 [Xanthoceras sorbifolium]
MGGNHGRNNQVTPRNSTAADTERSTFNKDRLEEDIKALENRIKEKSKTAGALLDITNGEGSNKYKKESAKGKLKMVYKRGKSFSNLTGKMQKPLENPSTQPAEVAKILKDSGVLRELHKEVSAFKGLQNIQEGSATPDRDSDIVGTVGLCSDIARTAVVVINSADSKFVEVASISKEAMVEDLA